jgi:hypothetical protein
MNVTPDREAPIIPYATTNHGETLFPIKNDSLLAFLEVSQVITNNISVYRRKIPRIRKGGIKQDLICKDKKKIPRQKI